MYNNTDKVFIKVKTRRFCEVFFSKSLRGSEKVRTFAFASEFYGNSHGS